MPSRNREKAYVSGGFYHIYNRGVNKRRIFKGEEDYSVFLNLLKRYLNDKATKDPWGREYELLDDRLELLAFCLMPNHFHLLIYQKTPEAMTRLLRGVSSAYSSYFNKRHRRTGPLFQDRFKASLILNDEYLQHISRYIHLNPAEYKQWEFSSLQYYTGRKSASWVKPQRILEIFDDGEYLNFLADYVDYKRSLNELKSQLANY